MDFKDSVKPKKSVMIMVDCYGLDRKFSFPSTWTAHEILWTKKRPPVLYKDPGYLLPKIPTVTTLTSLYMRIEQAWQI